MRTYTRRFYSVANWRWFNLRWAVLLTLTMGLAWPWYRRARRRRLQPVTETYAV